MRSGFPFGGRHQRTPGHLSACQDCASALRRERQYLERLREAPIPPASDDLTARLLTRTSVLAAESSPAAAHTPAPRTPVRMLALTAGSTVAAAGVLAAGAFAVAGEPATGTASAASFSQVSSRTPADGRALNEDQLTRLRAEGWACPELEAMGFHLESAKAVVVDGQPAVSLRLTDGTHYAMVTEQHAPGWPAQGGSGQQAAPPEVGSSSPWTATYRANGSTFTYESNLPADRADDALPILQQLGARSAAGVAGAVGEEARPAPEESLGTRMQRGINNIVALFTP